MALDERANFAKSTLASGIDNSTTSVVVASGEGAKFPTPTVGYSLVIWNMTDYPNPADDPSVEIVRATGLSTDTFTVTRGQEGTSASAHNTAEKEYGVALTVTKKTLDDIDAAYEPADATLQSSKHTHSNKATLDNITAAYTIAEASKLAGIAEGAEVNVQPDWNQATNTADDYIKNKPTIPDELADLSEDATHRLVTDTEKSTWNAKQAALGFTPENVANKVTSFQATPDDTHYASEKLVKNSLDAKMANPMTTAGDVIYGGTDGVPTRLAKGTAGQVLKMNSGATAPEWGAGSAGIWEEISKGQLSSASATLFSVTSISTDYDMFRIRIFHLNPDNAIRYIGIRLNADSAGNYANESSYLSSSTHTAERFTGQSSVQLGKGVNLGLSSNAFWQVEIAKPLTTTPAAVTYSGKFNNTTGIIRWDGAGDWNNTESKITGISCVNIEDGTAVFAAGSFYVIEGIKIT